MKHNKSLEYALWFAKWATNLGLEFEDAAELLTLVHRASKQQENKCNIKDYPESKVDNALWKVEDKAGRLGLQFKSWTGLYPWILDKKGREIYWG